MGHPSGRRGGIATITDVLVLNAGKVVTELSATGFAGLNGHRVRAERVFGQLKVASGTGETSRPVLWVGLDDVVERVGGSNRDVVDFDIVGGSTGLGSVTLARSGTLAGGQPGSKVRVDAAALTLYAPEP